MVACRNVVELAFMRSSTSRVVLLCDASTPPYHRFAHLCFFRGLTAPFGRGPRPLAATRRLEVELATTAVVRSVGRTHAAGLAALTSIATEALMAILRRSLSKWEGDEPN